MSFKSNDPNTIRAARKAGRASASARSADPVVDRYQVQAQMELDLLRELREAGPAAVRALRLRSPDAAGALEGHLAAWAVAQGKRAATRTEET